jgi:hypothetical protein
MGKHCDLREELINFLIANGETTGPNVCVPGARQKVLIGLMSRMANEGVINRRLVNSNSRNVWAFSTTQTRDQKLFNNEPEHVYVLRNLPRHETLEEHA